jgi:hypothetical protein
MLRCCSSSANAGGRIMLGGKLSSSSEISVFPSIKLFGSSRTAL